jgi:hypothetical protein
MQAEYHRIWRLKSCWRFEGHTTGISLNVNHFSLFHVFTDSKSYSRNRWTTWWASRLCAKTSTGIG